MLKEYEYDGATWQFEDGCAPEGAVLLNREAAKEPVDEPAEAADDCQGEDPVSEKSVEPVNKSRIASNKGSE